MSLMHVVQWRWPESQCVTSGDAIILWEGPTTQPTQSELVQAQQDYASDQIAEWADVRKMRNSLLTESDWTQIPDAQLTEAKVTEWQTYRQELRDIPENITDPSDEVEWPELPE